MIKTLTAYTREIDEADVAVEEILSQLNLAKNLCAHSVGIISCYSEFVESGVYEALCGKLPFDVIGATTAICAVPGACDQLMLSLTVLTSDTLSFSTAVSAPLPGAWEAGVDAAYREAAKGFSGVPSMLMTFVSLLQDVGNDALIARLGDLSGHAPNFGTVTVDHTMDYHTASILLNGKSYNQSLALLLIYGDITPRFYLAAISENKVMKQKAMITKSANNILMEVNNIPIIQYMESLGLVENGKIEGMNTIPFIVDYNDGTKPLARAIFALTPDGNAVCGAEMPQGATLSVGAIDYEDVLQTAEKTVRQALAAQEKQGIILFSCLSRLFALGVETMDEMNKVQSLLDGNMPYQFSISGGEICPVYDAGGKPINRFHNNTIIACAF